MRAHAIIFAAALLMLPLGARGADLVVWWEKGYYPQEDEAVREIIAAFEQASGNSKLLEQPFWLDASDPHRMAAVMQVASRPLVHNYAVASGNWRHDIVEQEYLWQKAIHRVVTEGISPEQAVDEAIVRIKQILSE